MSFDIREMVLDDFDQVSALWQASQGVGLSHDDDREGISRHLAFNPGLSFVAHENGQLIGAVICGQDGRRGYINHLAVSKDHRRRGIGEALVNSCLAALHGRDISKCHIFVFSNNTDAIAFWKNTGWFPRDELIIMSKLIGLEDQN